MLEYNSARFRMATVTSKLFSLKNAIFNEGDKRNEKCDNRQGKEGDKSKCTERERESARGEWENDR